MRAHASMARRMAPRRDLVSRNSPQWPAAVTSCFGLVCLLLWPWGGQRQANRVAMWATREVASGRHGRDDLKVGRALAVVNSLPYSHEPRRAHGGAISKHRTFDAILLNK